MLSGGGIGDEIDGSFADFKFNYFSNNVSNAGGENF